MVALLFSGLRRAVLATFTSSIALVSGETSAWGTPQGAQTVVLGQTQTVSLTTSGNVKPSSLTWKASAGSATVEGEAVLYAMPKTTFPQVALVGAYDPAARTAIVHRVLLVGSPTVEIRSEPNVEVTVDVGAISFGPVSTDSHGLARIKIDVPPGLASVKTFATDSYGNVTEGHLELNPPPFPRVLVVCAPAEEAAYVVEVNESGDFVATPSFETRVSEGRGSAPEAVSPGIFRVPLRVQNPTKDWKTVTLEVQHAGFADSCSFKVAPPPPSKPFKLNGSVTPIEPRFNLFVGGSAGYATNFGLVSGPWVSVHGSYPFSSTRDGLRVELALGYNHSNRKVSTDDGQSLELTVDSIPILLGPRYVFAWGLLHVSGAGHVGLSFTSESLVGPLTDQAANTTPLWFGGDLGVAWWLGSGDLGIRAAYSYAPIKQADITGNVAGLRAVLQYERGF